MLINTHCPFEIKQTNICFGSISGPDPPLHSMSVMCHQPQSQTRPVKNCMNQDEPP